MAKSLIVENGFRSLYYIFARYVQLAQPFRSHTIAIFQLCFVPIVSVWLLNVDTGMDDVKKLFSVSSQRVQARLGLEMAASLNRFDNLSSFLRNNTFIENNDFRNLLVTTRFNNVHANVCTYPPYDHKKVAANPIWHLKLMFQYRFGKFALVAFLIGVASLDENTKRCKGTTLAR